MREAKRGNVSRARWLCRLARWLPLAPLALEACGGGGGAGTPSADTLAYVVTQCREDADAATADQTLLVQHGTGAPAAVVHHEKPSLPSGVCQLFGETHSGATAVFGGGVQRLGVTPDGSAVVFEVTNDFSMFGEFVLTPEEEGIFTVRADGTGLRRLGNASREPCCAGFVGGGSYGPYFNFAPPGRTFVFADLGPGPTGEESTQIFTQDVASGQRSQVTHLPLAALSPATCCPSFLDAQTISFFSNANPDGMNPDEAFVGFTVTSNGKDLKALSPPATLPGSHIVSGTFAITGARREVVILVLSGEPVNPQPPALTSIFEVFIDDGTNLLQLTNFRRADTLWAVLSLDGQRVFLTASADPLGTNPTENCQIFSVDALGGDLRQLTHFGGEERSTIGCQSGPPPGCFVALAYDPQQGQNALNGTLIFDSSCDPFGTNPDGDQIFGIHPDGTDLRQLTNTRGVTNGADGSVMVELPGPWAYGPHR
jgi:hypothetical protein